MTSVYWILLPQVGISVVSWAQLVLSMNRYRGVLRFQRADLWALVLFLHGSFVRWIAALSVRNATLGFQLATAFLGAALGWTSFVLVFNEGFSLPTRQQSGALVMSLLVTGLWEINHRMTMELP